MTKLTRPTTLAHYLHYTILRGHTQIVSKKKMEEIKKMELPLYIIIRYIYNKV